MMWLNVFLKTIFHGNVNNNSIFSSFFSINNQIINVFSEFCDELFPIDEIESHQVKDF